jgi:ectoine hydroxylase-related dioxygenase (phytanoyl-CoA dioxygenase family)
MPFLTARPRVQPRTVQFWVALDDVDETTGCMHFVPGVHEQALHRRAISRPMSSAAFARNIA